MQGIAGNLAIKLGDPGGEEGRWPKAIAPADYGIEVRGLGPFSCGECRNQVAQQIGIGDFRAADGEVFHGADYVGPAGCRQARAPGNSRANSAMAITG